MYLYSNMNILDNNKYHNISNRKKTVNISTSVAKVQKQIQHQEFTQIHEAPASEG